MDIQKIKERSELLEEQCDKLQQYTRRNNLRLFGVPEDDNENLEEIALNIFNQRMGMSHSSSNIDRIHRLIRRENRNKKPRPIIIKFISYKSRNEVVLKRSLLKGSSISIQENLTHARYQILHKAFDKFKAYNVWKRDGNIFIKWNGNRLKNSKQSPCSN